MKKKKGRSDGTTVGAHSFIPVDADAIYVSGFVTITIIQAAEKETASILVDLLIHYI